MEKTQIKNKLHYALWYFIIFSVVGLIVETSYCYATMHILESRKGFYLGPFCPIYGFGATVLVLTLEKYKNNKFKLALYGGILGSVVEYLLSFILEALYGARFWDYGWVNYNLNGRICITYSIFWAILSVILVGLLCPKINKLIDKIGNNSKIYELGFLPKLKSRLFIDLGVFIFFIFDVLITIWAINTYQNRVLNDYYNIENKNKNNLIQIIEDNCFSNEKMLLYFPNLRVRDHEGKEIFVKNLLNEINNRN